MAGPIPTGKNYVTTPAQFSARCILAQFSEL